MRATVALAHDLGLRVVAEGVENELARNLVAEMGCDLYQGYGLSRPMPADEVLAWLARHDAHAKDVLDPRHLRDPAAPPRLEVVADVHLATAEERVPGVVVGVVAETAARPSAGSRCSGCRRTTRPARDR